MNKSLILLLGTTKSRMHVENLLIFWFRHYNAIQLEMLQEMGRENEILIPINENIFSSIKRSDRPYWVNKEGFENQDLSKNS